MCLLAATTQFWFVNSTYFARHKPSSFYALVIFFLSITDTSSNRLCLPASSCQPSRKVSFFVMILVFVSFFSAKRTGYCIIPARTKSDVIVMTNC